LAEAPAAEETGREVEVDEVTGLVEDEVIGGADEEATTALLEVVAADDRTDELTTVEEAGRADEVDEEDRTEVVTTEEDTRIEVEATEEAFEAEAETEVTGLAPDDLAYQLVSPDLEVNNLPR
jgi:hypothetical protein